MKIWQPHSYQNTAVMFMHHRTVLSGQQRTGGALFLDPGLGKTSICLEWMRQMIGMKFAHRFLVVAPLRVCYNVWPQEIVEWQNFHHMSYTVVHGGSSKNRRKKLGLPVNVTIVNRDAMTWLAGQCKHMSRLPWHAVIIDESTSFKTWSSARSKALRSLIPKIPFRFILTGTPAPKHLDDLYPQTWLIDEGATLGTCVTHFREKYCNSIGERNYNKFEVKPEYIGTIQHMIQPMCLRLDAKDYLSIPEKIERMVMVDLPPDAQSYYDEMERDMVVSLMSGDAKEAPNAGAKYNYCRQIANGGIYSEGANGRQAHHLHAAKTDACMEIIEELGGKPALIAYQFEHDLMRLKERIPRLHVIRGGMRPNEVQHIIDAWNAGVLDPPYLAVQPMALSYGVNMQKGPGRDIIWYGPTDSLDLLLQLIARIWRQGVGSQVRVHKLCCRNTIDELIWSRLEHKDDVQTNLLSILRQYAQAKYGITPR